MAFVRNTPSDENESERGGGEGPPQYAGSAESVEWNDPDLVLVHYDVSAWNHEQRAELAETLAERDVPHRWGADEFGNDELVVPEDAEEFVDELFAQLEAELGPFPVPLDADDPGTPFGLDEWASEDVDTLRTALLDGGIPHRWAGLSVLVATEAAEAVDDLITAIEAGEVASAEGEAPEGALHELYNIADELARDPGDASARGRLDELVPLLAPEATPFGLAVRAWTVIVDRANDLAAALDGGVTPEAVADAADELRSVTRPYV